jgi:hypothetical protein
LEDYPYPLVVSGQENRVNGSSGADAPKAEKETLGSGAPYLGCANAQRRAWKNIVMKQTVLIDTLDELRGGAFAGV